MIKISAFCDKKHFSPGINSLGIVVAGAPHEQNSPCSFLRIAPKRILSSPFRLDSAGNFTLGEVFRLQLQTRMFQM